jgi:Protein of unknown function (DUF1553)/Protein of unknown function (DUF1549)/Concanavalin A-like lectin/glucanases superfamily/Planctomycete cytochrome C
MRFNQALFSSVFLVGLSVLPDNLGARDAVSYNHDIRPILSENCFSCHGTDSASRKAGLRLDQPQVATNKLESGAVAIVPGKPGQSEMIRRIYAEDDDQMPPAKVNKTLKPEQKKLLKQWIADGAKYEPHWAFIPPQKAALPAVKNTKWVNNPVDNFILARLEQEKLKPNSEADKRTLIRRVTLDLTGLPPTPAEVENFVADKSPAAYEKLVDRLLNSPQWGEHRAHYWLDVARYGDTHGIHYDNYREMWTYRDWVINAFNANMPFDRFTVENLAGDLLPNATRDQQIGSGFNRCNITSNEGGLIEEEYLVLYARDRTETTAQTFLGLTAGCAVCHDHKYDPLTQKDFYSLSAFFNNITMKAMDGNIKDTPPVLVVPKVEDETRWRQLAEELPVAEKNVMVRKDSAHGDFTNWLANPDLTKISCRPPSDKLLFHAPLDDGSLEIQFSHAGSNQVASIGMNTNWQNGAVAAKAYTISGKEAPLFAGVGDFERTNAFSYAAWVRLDNHDKNGALFARMADKNSQFRGWDFWVSEGKPTVHIIHDWPKDAIKVTGRKELPKDRWNFITMTYDGSSKAKGVKIYVNGELQEMDFNNDGLKGSIRTEVPFKLGQRDTSSPVAEAGLQALSIFGRVLKPQEIADLMNGPRLQWLARKPADQRTQSETEELYLLWLPEVDSDYRQLVKSRDGLKAEEMKIRQRGTVAYVMNERTNVAEAYVLFRGQYDQRRDRVVPATPAFLPAMAADLPRNRLGFAEWLISPENPLTARVTVNRFWQELFGIGLVKTAGDFGVAGEVPSNQALLDWLAVDFREHGWDVKRIFKLMVMSATYRQSAVASPEKIERDPENRWLARGPRFRMDAEMVRDYALAASGLLVEKIGGPSTRPYQPPGIWNIVGMPGGNTREYLQDHGDNLYRRSVYTFWKRQAPPASMEIFNAPSRETCTVRRERTDTPLQALVTLNDPQFIEAARHLAQESLEQKSDALDFMAERLLARPLTAKEKKIIQANAGDLLALYHSEPKEAEKLLAIGESKLDCQCNPTKLAAYTMVANELMNLDEVLNK